MIQFQHLRVAAIADASPKAVASSTLVLPATAALMLLCVAVRLLDVTLGPVPALNCISLRPLAPLDPAPVEAAGPVG
jgi:hypothetical protein